MIFATLEDFLASQAWVNIKGKPLIVTSGGFSPCHKGHCRCLRDSAQLAHYYHGVFLVLVNGDGFLRRKTGREPFMKLDERLEIVDAIKGVDYAVGWEDESQTVVEALRQLKPTYFTKGGDRSSVDQVPEAEVCQEIGCQILYGIGGADKVQSSSWLIKASQGE